MATRVGAYKPTGMEYVDRNATNEFSVVKDPANLFSKSTFEQGSVSITAWQCCWPSGIVFHEEKTGLQWRVTDWQKGDPCHPRAMLRQRLEQVGGDGVLTPLGNSLGFRRTGAR